MTLEAYVTLLLALLVLVLVAILVTLLIIQTKNQQNQNLFQSQLLVNLLMTERTNSQSLLNQVRAADPMTLHGLQAATGVESPVHDPSFNVLPEELQYAQDLATNGLKVEDLDDDLHAAGWDHLITNDGGGTPIAEFRDS